MASYARTARDPTRSPWITSSTMSLRSAEITPRSPRPQVVPVDAVASHAVWRPEDEVLGFPVRGPVATSKGLPSVHSRSNPQHRLRPLRTPVTRTHWASATELQRPKLGKDSHLLANEVARRTAQRPPTEARGRTGHLGGRRRKRRLAGVGLVDDRTVDAYSQSRAIAEKRDASRRGAVRAAAGMTVCRSTLSRPRERLLHEKGGVPLALPVADLADLIEMLAITAGDAIRGLAAVTGMPFESRGCIGCRRPARTKQPLGVDNLDDRLPSLGTGSTRVITAPTVP